MSDNSQQALANSSIRTSQKSPITNTAINNAYVPNIMGKTVLNTIYPEQQVPNQPIKTSFHKQRSNSFNKNQTVNANENPQIGKNFTNSVNLSKSGNRTSNTPNRISAVEMAKNVEKTHISPSTGKSKFVNQTIKKDGKIISNIDPNVDDENENNSNSESKIENNINLFNNTTVQSFQIPDKNSIKQTQNQSLPTLSQKIKEQPSLSSSSNPNMHSQHQSFNNQSGHNNQNSQIQSLQPNQSQKHSISNSNLQSQKLPAQSMQSNLQPQINPVKSVQTNFQSQVPVKPVQPNLQPKTPVQQIQSNIQPQRLTAESVQSNLPSKNQSINSNLQLQKTPFQPTNPSLNPQMQSIKNPSQITQVQNQSVHPKIQSIHPQNQNMNQQRQSAHPQNQSLNQQKQSSLPQNQSIPPQNQSITPQNQSINAKNQCINQQKQSVHPKNQSIPPQNHSIPPQNISVNQQKHNIHPKNQNIPPQNQSISPQNQSVNQQKQSVHPQIQNIPPQNQSINQQKQSVHPQIQNIPPQNQSAHEKEPKDNPRKSNKNHQQNQHISSQSSNKQTNESNKLSESKLLRKSSLKASRNKSPPKVIRTSDGKIKRVELDNSGNSYYVTVDEDKIVSDSYISSHLNDYLSNEIEISKSKVVNPQSSKKGIGFRYYGELTKAGRNQDGKTKTDQDTPLVKLNVGDIPGFNMFGVLDGHGQHGHFVSQFCRDHFIKRMTSYAEYCKSKKLMTAESIYNELKRTGFDYIKETFSKADEEMAKQTQFDYNFSGTTCNIAFQFNKNLVCASVGDSRGIIIEEKGNSKINIIQLSTDHKPDLPGEIDRIHLSGGIVDKITDYFGEKVGPPRVWKAGTNYPGLAMSRSLGDFQAKSCGVVNVPQIVEYYIQHNTKFMTICSDGVWEFIQNEQVATLGFEFYKKNDVAGFCTDLVKFAVHSWEQFDIIRDDITVVCVYF